MTTAGAGRVPRYERTLRAVMWLDAFLSVALAAVCALATPIIATLGVPSVALFAVAIVSVVSAILLAAFGAITAVVVMLRMRAGQYLLPAGLRLPLPRGMRPMLVSAKREA